MFIEERKEKILNFVEKHSSVTVKELCDLFHVSEVTIRKDLKELGNEGLLIRTHGGAVKLKETTYEQNQTDKGKERIYEKRKIAQRAYQEINDLETIILDAGTTTQELAKIIRQEDKKLTVVTNALNIANELIECKNVEVILIGGYLRKNILSCVGGFTEELFGKLIADKVFLGINNISIEYGLTTPNMQECKVKQSMLQAARRKYLLVDSSKFKTNSLYRICGFKDLNMIITDDTIDKSYISKISERDGNVVTVNVKKR